MRYIRVGVLILFILGIGLYGIAGYREKEGIDPTRPVLTSDTEILEISCDYTEEELFAGLHAEDERDGDLTGEIMLGDLSRFQEPGRCKATYVVFDSANQAATLTREVVFTDYNSPHFTLSQPLVFTKETAGNAPQYVGASDMLDGDISSLVRLVEQDINYMAAGDYSMQMEVTNSFGDLAEITLPVHVVEPAERRLSIDLRDAILYLEQGESFDPASFVESVSSMDGTVLDTDIVAAESGVDTSMPGCYEVQYTASLDNGDMGVTWLVVIVE